MNENDLKKTVKSELVFYWIVFVIFAVVQICCDIYAVKTFVFNENSRTEDYVFSIMGMTATIIGAIKIMITGVIPYTKDVNFYKNNDVERMRGVIVKIKRIRKSSNLITVKNLETGENVEFDYANPEIGKDKIYDFIYLKNSKIFRYEPVSFEQLTEDNREKASKIDFNQKD